MKNIIKLGNYSFSFDPLISYKTHECESYSCIIFYLDGVTTPFTYEDCHTYEIVNNYHMGYRLIINNERGWADLPFKEATFGFLPEEIKVIQDE